MNSPHARNTDDVTSHRAIPANLNDQCVAMLKAYKKYRRDGLTAKEAEYISGVSWRRSSDLKDWGFIENSDETRVCRFSGVGKAGRVRVITTEGIERLRLMST
jgi:hypothetical protein